MKHIIKYVLQKILGLENYLFIFSLVIIKKLRWDKREKDFLFFLTLLPPKSVMLDIGANIGVMTVHMARKFSDSVIYSFEPVPVNLTILKKVVNHYKLGNVRIHEYALGDYTGNIEMILPVDRNVSLHGLSHVKHQDITWLNEGKEFKVAIKKLDDIEELGNSEISGIKLDVENYEYYVLKGGVEMLKRCKPVIYCELWNNENRQKTMELLQGIGYEIKVRVNDSLVHFNATIHTMQNFFFIPVK